jgi:spore maturation protein CgeB
MRDMNFLIIDSVYPRFLHRFYSQIQDYEIKPYQGLLQKQMDECLGMADFYISNLKKMDQESSIILANDPILQKKWQKENLAESLYGKNSQNSLFDFASQMGKKWCDSTGEWGNWVYRKIKVPFWFLCGGKTKDAWIFDTLLEQIKSYKPDVLYIHPIGLFNAGNLKEIKPFVKCIVGQHASPIPSNVPYSQYDLILSSLPNQVAFFRQQGVKSEYFRLAFEPSILDRLGHIDELYPACFVGGFSVHHHQSYQVFERVANEVPVEFWGYGGDELPCDSAIKRHYHGEAWGIGMYRILAQSKIALNRHINIAENYANNMRLFEATGVGTLLITDMKDNLNDLFEVGKEVVAYKNPEECVELVRYYLENEKERNDIALAGQQRTLAEHTYLHRMQELGDIISSIL